jgi:23S rRNA (cytidine1920-2'-O)/16S rRNA (cytidine1409-2'-O)-methyltransferase
MSVNKIRLDELLVDKNLVETRSQAKALIMAGKVLVDEVVVDKAGTLVSLDAVLRLKETNKFVSRGGIKLEAALTHWNIDAKNKICLDVGASTGGFSDCLLQAGATKVYAVDVGYGQMHWKLQKDARVVRFDRDNFRYFDLAKITDVIDVVVMDVSFISIKLLIPKIRELFTSTVIPAEAEIHKPQEKLDSPSPLSRGQSLKRGNDRRKTLIALIKPQFEAGFGNVDRGGIVKDEAIRKKVVDDILKFVTEVGFKNPEILPSPIPGPDGPVEYVRKCGFS